MTKFLFWNINRRPVESIITILSTEHSIDVLILAESAIGMSDMLESLNRYGDSQFHSTYSECEKIQIYTRFPRQFITPVAESHRYTVRRLMLPGLREILLCAVHFPDKSYWSEQSQSFECVELAKFVHDAEQAIGHSRTVLVGDLNMNPFEAGLVSAPGLNAVMDREVALRLERTVQMRQYPFFYNPMWGCFGDATVGPSGTYYYDRAEHRNYFWNVFDQVLIRPELLDAFTTGELKILTQFGRESLLSPRGLPDTNKASDHLPIVFELNL